MIENKQKKLPLNDISLSRWNFKKIWYIELLAGTLIILSIATPGESGLATSKVYAEQQHQQQIYAAKMLHGALLTVPASMLGQQQIQQPIENQTEIQQPSSQHTTIHAFEDTFVGLVNDTRSLSIAYQDEIAKLQSGVYDNQTFVTITDLYLQMYQQLLDRAKTLNQSTAMLPANYSRAIDLYSESIRTEMLSQEHFRNYLTTGDLSENERSLELLTDSLRYELEAFRAFRSVVNDTAIQNNL